VRYETRAGTATSGDDYLPTQGRLDWADGDASDRVITIALLADREIEGTEKFVLALSVPSGASLGLLAQFEVVIEASTAQGVVPTSVAPTGSTVASNGGGGGGGAIDPSLTGALLAWWAMRVRRGNFRAPMVRDATTG
jgi:PDZ domain-containing secreted protein